MNDKFTQISFFDSAVTKKTPSSMVMEAKLTESDRRYLLSVPEEVKELAKQNLELGSEKGLGCKPDSPRYPSEFLNEVRCIMAHRDRRLQATLKKQNTLEAIATKSARAQEVYAEAKLDIDLQKALKKMTRKYVKK